MSFGQAIRTCLRKYITFSGRARRREYWFFVLFLLIGSIVVGLIDALVFGTTVLETGPGEVTAGSDGPLASLFGLATLLPLIAAGWRRMHDTGRSGLYLLYPIIVVVGITLFMGMLSGFDPLMDGDFATLIAGGSTIILGVAMFVLFLSPLLVLWWLTRPSDPGTNAYGPNPKGTP